MADVGVVQLKTMIMNFRVAELQMLLGFAGKSKNGKKNELQTAALELLKARTVPNSIANKIKELHRQRYNNTSYLGAAPNIELCDSTDMNANYDTNSCSVTTRSASVHMNQQSAHPMNVSSNTTNAYSKQVSQSAHPRTDYYTNMPRIGDYPPKPFQAMTANVQMPYPVYPDVRFKALPFYDVLGELLRPSSLMPSASSRFQESTFAFVLTPQQANDVAMSRDVQPGPKVEYCVQIQLRFCLLETSCEQEDNFPPSICVKVNSKMCPLPNPLPTNKPGVEPKRPSRPVNITTLCRLSPTVQNQISISWAADYGRPYAVGVFLVRKLTSHTLLTRIKSKGIRNSDYTRAMIKEKLSHDPDSEIATMSLRGSLLCPLGKMRITIPCRATTCAHVQCFDALLYLQMNEKKPTWICPVCDKPAVFANLAIDGLFTDIMKDASSCSEVQFHEDGSWTPVVAKKENKCETLSPGSRKTKNKREMTPEQPEPKRPKVDVITIDSSDDDDDTVDEESDTTKASTSTPVLSSGSGSESGTPNHIQSLPSPDSSSSASTSALRVNSQSNTPTASFYSSTSLNSNPIPAHSSSYPRSGISSSSLMQGLGRSSSLSMSSYTSMPLLNSPFYSANVPCFPDSISSPFNYSNPLSMEHTFDTLFRAHNEVQNRETPYSNQRSNDDMPDIISID